ncbi:MAG: methylenetetrahydrofolate reductase [Lachnospiraceae bacterium]|jgi:methylenetetrahydrofolate reductase (NADPH)|nr:methylenetetrahydrofolate reductase [Lachnospiraceae bacterium]
MRISDVLKQDRVTLSFEVFPPKKADGLDAVKEATEKISALHPDFMSITYGAGGSTSRYTVEVAAHLHDVYGVTVLPHLTCISSTRADTAMHVREIQDRGLENIMALRGDIPADGLIEHDYAHACDLIADIKSHADLCIGGACYPEGHPESASREEDIRHLREKVDAGCDFLTTQMFFDNNILYNFLYRIREKGITVPVLAGIMPITNAKQLSRSVSLSGTHVPERFRSIVDRFGSDPAAMTQAGIIYASEQIIDLIANGITHIHVYSMNKPAVAAGIMQNISDILGYGPGSRT